MRLDLRAARSIDASPELVFGFLESFERHIELIDDRVIALSVGQTGSQVRLRGPLGVTRTVRTLLTGAESPRSIIGRVEAGRRTRGTVRWSIEPAGRGSRVEVLARAERLGLLDQILVVVGGRRWLARSLRLALERLDAHVRQPLAAASGKDAAQDGVFMS